MTNGAECVIRKIDYRVANSERPSIIWVIFYNAGIGCNQSKQYSHLYTEEISPNWVPILEITIQFKVTKSSQVKVLRRQFPLRPASAKTVHRCQGATLINGAVVDFPPSAREHMHYVGLSRVQSIKTSYIVNLNENRIKVSKKVKQEMFRLRTEAMLTPCIPFLYKIQDRTALKILLHNVRSLHLHIDDVARDDNVKAAHINILVETALFSCNVDDNYQLENFNFYRNDIHTGPAPRVTYGTAVYVRNSVNVVSPPFCCNYNDVEITVTVVNNPIANLHVVGIYRSKAKVNITKLIHSINHLHTAVLQDNPTIILGDFNVDLLASSSEKNALLREMIEVKGYTQLINQYTTDYRSQLDHIYTNIPLSVGISSGVLKSYYSDHKPVFISLHCDK